MYTSFLVAGAMAVVGAVAVAPAVAVSLTLLGSLSTRVFETRTVTGSQLFSLLTRPHTTTFTLLSIFSPLETSSIKIWKTILS